MAQSKRLIVQIGNGASPEVFSFTCGANQWSVTFENATGESMTLDCTDPLDNAATMERWVEAQNTNVTLSGNVTTTAFSTWRGWADGGTTKNVKIFFDESSGNGGGFWIVPMILTSLELAKEGQGIATFSAELVSNGVRAWTAAS